MKKPPEGFKTIARTEKCPCAALCDDNRKLYGVQFHPEVSHTVYGRQIIRNFIFSICGCRPDWKAENFVESAIQKYKSVLSGKKVLLALSGGVDSTVAAALLQRPEKPYLRVCARAFAERRRDYVENLKRRTGYQPCECGDRFLTRLSGCRTGEKRRL